MVQQYFSISNYTKQYTEKDILNEIYEDVAILIEQGYTELAHKSYTVGLDNATTRFGFCRKGQSNHPYISISRIALATCEPSQIHNTIMHEVCHTVNGGHGHTDGWLRASRIINRLSAKGVYDFTEITRTNEDEGYSNYHKQISKYTIKCESCNREFYYQRRSTVVKSVAKHEGTAYCCCGSHKLILI